MALLGSRSIYGVIEHRGWLPWGALAPFLAIAFMIATELAGLPLVKSIARFDEHFNPVDPFALFVYAMVPFGLLGLLMLAWVRFVERRSFASIGLCGEHKVRTFLTGHAIGMVSILGVVALITLCGGLIAGGSATAWSTPSSLGSIALLLAGFGLQSSVEELVFRGWLLSLLAKKFNVVAAVLVNSALFALVHFSRGEPWLVNVADFAFGMFACAWALRARSILGVMGWHAGWNWLLAVGFGLPLTGIDVGIPALLFDLAPDGPAWLSGGAEGPEGSIICLAAFVLATAWLFLARKRASPAAA
jgi:membrane protease YdiL (CAAX protease family)